MSSPKTGDKETKKNITEAQMCAHKDNDRRNERELAATLRAMALSTQDPLAIFKLNVDCWEFVFDWLSLNDLHAFGQTCKFFHRIVGQYFNWKYKRVVGHVYDDSMTINWKELNKFNEFAQRLTFYSCDPDASLLYALEHCKSAIEMEFVNSRSNALDVNRLGDMLVHIEILTIKNFYLPNEFSESLLKLCAMSLKRLRIEKNPGNIWMHHKYPKLQHLELLECDSTDDLINFLKQNPNVRSFSTSAANILENREKFLASTLKLKDLTILRNQDIDAIPTILGELYERGFYKRLHFITATNEHLMSLPGLTTLHIDTYNYMKIPDLSTVTGLVFQALWNGLCSWLDMDELSKAFKNLEYIFTPETRTEYMMPFIRNATKLKEIKMEYFRNDLGDIDPVLMNNEREKLDRAHKAMIYVNETDYLKVKWKYNKYDFGLIEIKRMESYDGVWDNTFGYY